MIAENVPLVQLSGNDKLVKLIFENDCTGEAVIRIFPRGLTSR